MAIQLAPEQERILNSQVASGRYRSPAEAIDHALRLLEEESLTEEQRMALLIEDLNRGLKQVDLGQVHEFEPTELKLRIREQLSVRPGAHPGS